MDEENPAYDFTVLEGPDKTMRYEGMGGITFGGTEYFDRIIFDYSFYFESNKGVPVYLSYTGPINSSYRTTLRPVSASGIDFTLGFQLTDWLKPYFGLKSHTLSYYAMTSSSNNSFQTTTVADNRKYYLAGLEFIIPFSKSVGLSISADYAKSFTNDEIVEYADKVTINSGIRWGLESH